MFVGMFCGNHKSLSGVPLLLSSEYLPRQNIHCYFCDLFSELKAVVKTLGQMVWQGPDSIVPRAQLELLNIMMDASVITEVRTKATELVVNWALRDPSQTDATLACLPVVCHEPSHDNIDLRSLWGLL
jgi:hypothetical protein